MSFTSLLHSVSYSGSWGQPSLTLDQFIDKAADLGFDGVMLMAKRPHLSLLDYGEKERASLRQHLEKRNLRETCIAGYNNFTADLEHGEVPQREMQIHYITGLARLARDLGGGLVRIFTGYEHPAQGFTPQWNLVVGAIKECARRASEFGVTIGVQNHHDLAAGFESQYDLITAVDEPNCKRCSTPGRRRCTAPTSNPPRARWRRSRSIPPSPITNAARATGMTRRL